MIFCFWLGKFAENLPRLMKKLDPQSDFVHSRRERDHGQVMRNEDEKYSRKQYEFLSRILKKKNLLVANHNKNKFYFIKTAIYRIE